MNRVIVHGGYTLKSIWIHLAKLFQNKWVYIIGLYCVAYGLMVINDGIYFDDWVCFHVDPHAVYSVFMQAGYITYAHLNNWLFSIGEGIVLTRFLVFISYLLVVVFFDQILKTIKKILPFDRLILVLFFGLYPCNNARICNVDFSHIMNYFLFFCAFWLTTLYINKKNIIIRIIALILFFFSFFTPSFLVFYACIVLYIFYRVHPFPLSLKRIIHAVFAYIDFVLIPIIYWIARNLYFRPSGLYAEYNQVSFKTLLIIPCTMLRAFQKSFIDILNEMARIAFVHAGSAFVIASFFLFLLIRNISRRSTQATEDTKRYDLLFFIIGCAAFFIALFPYLAVGKIPNMYNWDSRQEMLIPLGVSFMLYYGLNILFTQLHIMNSHIKIFIYSLIITAFVCMNFFIYFNYQKDWFKQLALVENFKTSDTIKNHTSFLFIDNTPALNAQKRAYRFYEYTGLMKYAFHDETRFGSDTMTFTQMDNYKTLTQYPQYNISQFSVKEPEYNVIINYGSYPLSLKHVLELMYYRASNSSEYKKRLKNIIELKYRTVGKTETMAL